MKNKKTFIAIILVLIFGVVITGIIFYFINQKNKAIEKMYNKFNSIGSDLFQGTSLIEAQKRFRKKKISDIEKVIAIISIPESQWNTEQQNFINNFFNPVS